MIDVRFILINKLILMLVILTFFSSVFVLIKFYKKRLSPSSVLGTIKLCILGLFLLFFEAELSNIIFYGKLIKKLQEIIAIICFANFINYIVVDFLIYFKTKKEVPPIIKDAVRLFVYLIFALASLKIIFNIEVSSIITTSAVLTAAIAFAMQNTLSNIISGFSVQIDKNLKKDTWINLKDKNIHGQIESVGFRYTILKTLENEKIIVPNNILLQNIIYSYGRKDDLEKCALNINIGIGYEVPPLKAKKMLINILNSHSDISKTPEPKVYTANFADNFMEMRMRFFINDYSKKDIIRDDILTQAWYAIIREGYSIPYPHREIIEKKVTKIFEPNTEQIKTFLKNIDIFKLLSDEDLLSIINKSSYKVYGNGEVVVKQNDSGDSLFFVIDGELDVYIDNSKIGNIDKGEIFGEMSLLTGEKRTATIIARREVHLLEITKENISPFIQNGSFVEALANLIVERQLKNITLTKLEHKETEIKNRKQDFTVKLKKFFGLD